MTQEEIYNLLRENKGRKYFAKDIQNILGLNEASTHRCIAILFRNKFISADLVKIPAKTKLEKKAKVYYYEEDLEERR